ncbi:MAG: hypothetical protein AAFX85_02895 [Pseudomonadota bacterium]
MYFADDLPNGEWQSITLRQLASHMAGIPHYGDNEDWLGRLQTASLRKSDPVPTAPM